VFTAPHTVCWAPTWGNNNLGLEHVRVAGNIADSSLLALDDDGEPFRLTYRLQWDDAGCLRQAELEAMKGHEVRSLALRADGRGHWRDSRGEHLAHLDGCIDIDIWPTPLTNSFPIWRSHLQIGQRQEYRMAWVSAPDLEVVAKPQAYTRLAERLYLFESLDGTGFKATLPVDPLGFVTDYPELFRRIGRSADPSFGDTRGC
jgi:hypothetical protein